MKKLTFKLLFAIAVFPFLSIGQDVDFNAGVANATFKAKRVLSPSPEASALGKYGNTSVSLFTGTPNISVPIFELKGNNLQLPISLSYNAGGFKPNEIATWVGLGWSLNAGGIITRAAIGNPDLSTNYFDGTTFSPAIMNDLFTNYDIFQNALKGEKEVQPDCYYYNFNGHSGKFYIDRDLSIVKKKKDNIKISALNITSPSGYFEIVDESGIKYRFDHTEYSVSTLDEYIPINTGSVVSPRSYTYNSSWYLSNITSADGMEQLVFDYHTVQSPHLIQTSNVINQAITYTWQSGNQSGGTALQPSMNIASISEVRLYNRKYIKKITLKKGGNIQFWLDFESSINSRLDLNHTQNIGFPDERKLDNIGIRYNDGTQEGRFIKKVNLAYDYFLNTTNSSYASKRLKLIKVQEIANDGVSILSQPYLFEYNDNSTMPHIETMGIDHWGFYNESNNSTLIPTINLDGNIYGLGANREANLGGSSYAILNKITYPTGGYSTYEFELNQSKVDLYSQNQFDVGGIRIKKITDYAFANKKATIKKYEYKLEDNSESGSANYPNYFSSSTFHHYAEPSFYNSNMDPTNIFFDYNSNDFNSGVGLASFIKRSNELALRAQDNSNDYKTFSWTISASPSSGLGTLQGNHIGYKRVIETSIDESSNQTLGKTIYEFDIAGFKDNDDYLQNGELLKTTVYDNSNRILTEQTNEYVYNTLLAGFGGYRVVPSIDQDNKINLCKHADNTYEWQIPGYSYANSPGCIETRQYKTKYQYSGYSITGQEKKLSKQTLKTYDATAGKYILSTKEYTYDNPLHTLPTSIKQNLNQIDELVTYKKYPLDYPLTNIVGDEMTQGIKNLQEKNIVAAEIEVQQVKQNTNGSNKRIVSGIITKYDPVLPFPVAVFGLKTSTPSSVLQLSSSNGNFSMNPAYQQMGTFSYDGNYNLSQQTKVNDLTKSYLWDYNNSIPVSEITNASANEVAYTSFETPSSGNWQISGSQNRIMGGTTGNYYYLLQGGSSIYFPGLSTNKQYVLSYWSQNGPVSINIPNAVIQGESHKGWTYFEHNLNIGYSSVSLTSNYANIDELRLYPINSQMSTVTHLPGVGVSSQSNIASKQTYYEYDNLNRLINVKDADGNIIQNTKYNYGLGSELPASPQSLYYSNIAQNSYTKNNGCPVGAEPETINYISGYGKFVSILSQEDADSKAMADVYTNGQTYANNVGKCIYWNTEQSLRFSKNDCLVEQGSSICGSVGPISQRVSIAYIVPAHKYQSLFDLNSANQKAQNDITANGQKYANENCTCSCSGEGKKVVNGVCETGVRYNSSTTYVSGQWQCVYYYVFSDNSISQNYTSYSSTPCPIY